MVGRLSSADLRGWRVALVADSLVNSTRAAPGSVDVLAVLDTAGYGVLQLPPVGENKLLLAVIADQVQEYAHHGYAVVAVGMRGDGGDGLHWRALGALLRQRGVAVLPPRYVVETGDEEAGKRLEGFLRGYDLGVEEQRRWRV